MLIETLQWLRYPDTIPMKSSSETFRLDSSIEINYLNSYKSIVKWLIIFQDLSSKYNLRLQTTISKASNWYSALSKLCTIALFSNSVRNRLYVWLLHKYEASNCQQLFNLLHWNVMTNHKNDNIAQLFYSLPSSVLNSYEIFTNG